MSKTIDERVVSMQFDNRLFESNVKTSMSTLDKLKQKLNFSGASKGLENISSASKNVNFSGLSGGIDTVHAKFSALEVIGVTALANITNSAVNTGKQMVKALTLDPIMSGFQEYETQIGAVQTILANTKGKGSTLDDVNSALNELNKYADQTIYNFTEMTRNIGTFTAAGVDLDKSVTSIKGIANLAAVSGSTSQQASTAMYQLSQALAAGKIQLMDWNSVVNAGMGGEIFQDALKRTATQMGTNVDALIKKYGSFRESLTRGNWLTAEVLTETLTQLSGAYSKADLIAQGYSEKQAQEIADLADTAVSAATEVKTFTQLWDTLKEAAQSGWTQTWMLLIGDFEEAKELLTGISESVGGVIEKFSNARNDLLEGALGGSESKWEDLKVKIEESGIAFSDFESKLQETAKESGIAIDALITKHGSLSKAFASGELPVSLIISTLKKFAKEADGAKKSTEDMTGKLEYFQKVVDQVWHGDYKNGEERIKALTDAGYDYATVQNLVNKTVDGHRLTLEDLSDAQLKNLGYTEEEIKKIGELAAEAEKTGTPINELINSLNKPSGRELLIDSFRNALQGLIKPITAVGKAYREIFPPMTSDQLYGMIEGLHELSKYLNPTSETLDKITRSFKGLFAILDIVSTILGGGLRIGLKLLAKLLGMADVDILSITASLGDMAVAFHDFLFENNLIVKGLDKLSDSLVAGAKIVKKWIDAFLKLPSVQKGIKNVKDSLLELKDIGGNIIDGLANGLEDGAARIPEILIGIGKSLIDAIKDVLGIHSPSVVMYAIGMFAMAGLLLGLVDNFPSVIEFCKEIGSKIIDAFDNIKWDEITSGAKDKIDGFENPFRNGLSNITDIIKGFGPKISKASKNINWNTIFAVGASASLLFILKKMADAFSAITAPLEGLGDLLSGVGEVMEKSAKGIGQILKNAAKVVKSFANVMNAFAFRVKAKALFDIALAIGVVAASIYVLAQLDTDKLWGAIGALAALAAIIGALTLAVGKFGPGQTLNFASFGLATVGIAVSLLIMAMALKKIESIDPEKQADTVKTFLVIIGSLMSILAIYGMIVRGRASSDIEKAGSMFLKLSVSMLILVGVIKLLSGMSPDQLEKGLKCILAFVGIFALLGLITTFAKSVDKLALTLIGMSAAMILLVYVIKLIAGLSPDEIKKGLAAIAVFVGVFALLALITRLGGGGMAKLGLTLLAMAAAMLLLTLVIKLISGMSVGDLIKGGLAILAFLGIMALMVLIIKMGGNTAPKMAGTLLAMAVAIGILAGVAIILSLIDTKGLAKGIIAVGMLGAIMSLMIVATRGASDCKGNLIVMTVAIGVMAAAVALLSLIDPKRLIPASIALSMLMGMFALMVKSTEVVNTSMKTLIVMTVVVGVLAGLLLLLSRLDVEQSLSAALSLSALMLALSLSMKIISKSGDVSPNALAAVGVMTLVVGALAGILWLIKDMPVESTLANTLALSTLLMALSAAIFILDKTSSISPMALAAVGVITLVVGALAGILWLIQDLPVKSTLANTLALSTLLMALSASVLLLNASFAISPIALAAVGVMTLVMGALAGILWLIRDMPVESTLANAQSLSMLLLALSGACLILTVVGLGGPAALIGVGSLIALIVSVGELLIAIGALVTYFPKAEEFINKGIPILEKIGYAIGSLFGNIIGGFSAGVTSGLPEIGRNISEFIENLDSVKNVDENSVKGVKSLVEMMAMLSGGNLLESLTTFFTGSSSMDIFSTQLDAFADAIVSFSSKVKGNIDESSVLAAANAGKLMAEMESTISSTGGVAQFFAGEKNMAAFGDSMIQFGEALVDFSNVVSKEGAINESAVVAAANAGKIMSEMQSSIAPIGGVAQFFAGSKDLSYFGTQLTAYGEAIVSFSNAVSKEGAINESAIIAAANAGKIMTEMQNSLVKVGGVFQFFSGTRDLTTFGAQLTAYGDAIVSFSNTVSKEGAINESAIMAAANSGKIMSEMQNSLEPVGGVMSFFEGSKNMKTFGEQISAFGDSIASFSESVNGKIDEGAVTAAANAGKVMASLQKAIPKEGGWFSDETTLSDFGKNIKKFGEGLADYSETVIGIDQGAVTSSLTSARSLISLAKSVVGLDTSGIGQFNIVTSIGKAIGDYARNVSDIDPSLVSSSITSAKQLVSLIKSMVGLDVSGVGSFASAMTTLGSTSIENFVRAFSSSSSKLTSAGSNMVDYIVKGFTSKQGTLSSTTSSSIDGMINTMNTKQILFKASASQFMEKIISAIKEKKPTGIKEMTDVIQAMIEAIDKLTPTAKSQMTNLVSQMVSGAREYYDSFYSAGSYLVSGFASGISENSYKAAAASRAMAKKAAKAAEEALDINSPSRVFRKIANFAGEGFVIGLEDYVNKSHNVGTELADSATTGLGDAIRKLGYSITDDIDTEPRIRPVLDLDDIRNGAGLIGSMLNFGSSYGIMSNLNAIGSSMNQNGGRNDIVYAIDKLRKDIGNMSNTTYQIGGVTYDDGSNVSDAVRTLVRAARIERRI